MTLFSDPAWTSFIELFAQLFIVAFVYCKHDSNILCEDLHSIEI